MDSNLHANTRVQSSEYQSRVLLAITLGNQRFPARVWLLAMYRNELSTVIVQLMYKCL